VLEVDEVAVRFGGVHAVRGVSFRVSAGEVLGLIGPNGSGKTTLLNAISGVHRPAAGTITLGGARLTGRAPHAIAGSGVARTFQVPRVFSSLTVMENMLLPAIDGGGGHGDELEARAAELLELVGLQGRAHDVASLLSGGQQKLLEFARALITKPSVVLMDEPFAGVHPTLIRTMRDGIARRRDAGTSFIIVSHEIPPLMEVSDRVICVADGAVLVEGGPEEVVADEAVIAAYLGAPTEARGG
jgi:ABC-type branched-subunit amino acid transport system ATPase component